MNRLERETEREREREFFNPTKTSQVEREKDGESLGGENRWLGEE